MRDEPSCGCVRIPVMSERSADAISHVDSASVARRRPAPAAVMANVAMVAGAGLVAWSAAIHFDLWQTGYRDIATIGPLFLAQAIGGFALAAIVVGLRKLLAAVAAVGYMAATVGGLLWSAHFGLFGFHDSLDAPFAKLSLFVEITGLVVLMAASILRVVTVGRRSTD
jgi:hypothetical protein